MGSLGPVPHGWRSSWSTHTPWALQAWQLETHSRSQHVPPVQVLPVAHSALTQDCPGAAITMPVPESARFSACALTVSVRVRVAARGPKALGRKRRSSVQVPPPGTTALLQVSLETTNSASLLLMTASAPLSRSPSLVTVHVNSFAGSRSASWLTLALPRSRVLLAVRLGGARPRPLSASAVSPATRD